MWLTTCLRKTWLAVEPKRQSAPVGLPFGSGLFAEIASRRGLPRFADAVALTLVVAQSLGWLGNYFNQELFGGTVQAPVGGLDISPGHHPPGYLQYSIFEPTFLYEIVWNLWSGGGVG